MSPEVLTFCNQIFHDYPDSTWCALRAADGAGGAAQYFVLYQLTNILTQL